MRGRLEPKDTVERFWGLKFIGFPNLSDETPKPASKTRALGSPSGSLEHRCLFYCHWLIRGRLSQKKTGGLGRVGGVGWLVGSQ